MFPSNPLNYKSFCFQLIFNNIHFNSKEKFHLEKLNGKNHYYYIILNGYNAIYKTNKRHTLKKLCFD